MVLTPALSVTLNVIATELQDVVGVPEITPPELSDSPAGNVPKVIAHLYGAVPPVAVKLWE